MGSFPHSLLSTSKQWTSDLCHKKCVKMNFSHGTVRGSSWKEDFFATFSPVSPTNPPKKSLERETKLFDTVWSSKWFNKGLHYIYIHVIWYIIILCVSIFTYLSIYHFAILAIYIYIYIHKKIDSFCAPISAPMTWAIAPTDSSCSWGTTPSEVTRISLRCLRWHFCG